MDLLFLGIVVFLLLLAVFDLWVGVSNDAVNFLTSAVGSKAASFKRVIAVAAVGVFIGASMNNGMMDIARHGIFNPANLSFYDIIAIFMATMVTDILILDIFNSLGMPTSTTVSLVFELLGASFVVALFKISAPGSELNIGNLLNSEKALSVIMGIFLSVAIAFVFGTAVQFLSRLVFTFEYKNRLRWKVGLFGGVACTAIVYFMLLKGIKDLTVMTPGQGVDQRPHAAYSRGFACGIHAGHAGAPLVQDQCVQGGGPARYLFARHGLCGQRSRELHRGSAHRALLLAGLHGCGRRQPARLHDGEPARFGQHAGLFSARSRCHHGGVARHVSKSPSGNADDGRIELENFGRRDVRLFAHRPLFSQNDAQCTRVGERTCAGQTQKMGKPPDG